MRYNYFLCLCLVLLANVGKSQIEVGEYKSRFSVRPYTDQEIAQLKKTKTLFFYTKDQADSLEVLKKAIQSVWTLTEVEFISIVNLSEYRNNPKYSFISLSRNDIETTYGNSTWRNTYIYLALWTEFLDAKGQDGGTVYARIELFPTYETMNSENVKDVEFRNTSIGILKVFFGCVHNHLMDKSSKWLYQDYKDAEIANLQKETLYVPDYTLIKFENGKENKKHDESKLFEDYKFNYKIVSAKELEDLILTSNKPIYFLSYVKSSTEKYVTIYNSKTNKMVYSNHGGLSYNIKDKDFAHLSEAILKQLKINDKVK